MEETAELLKAINNEVAESKATLQTLSNEVKALGGIINPTLAEHANALRSSRMTVVAEVTQSLTAMKDVRKFFLDSSYDLEVNRLERFIKLCKDIQELKALGVLDAVCDIAIRLAVREEQGK